MHGSTSVIIPVRNGAGLIGEAIASALAQLHAQDELLVVDDASTDATCAVVAACTDPRVRLLSCPGLGVAAARNVGLRSAHGEYVAFLDHDDTWPASRHDVMRRVLQERSDVDAVFGRIRVKFEQDSHRNDRVAALDGRHVAVANVGAGLFRKRIVDLVSGFDEGMHFGEDVDFYFRLTEAGMRMDLCDIDGLLYRRHGSNSSNDLDSMKRGMGDVLIRRINRQRQRASAGES